MSLVPSISNLGRFWTAANALSLCRLGLVVPITIFLWRDGPLDWLLGLVIVVILTDWFDGRIARWTHTVSDWGKVIDPVADKFAAIMTVTALTFRPADPHLPLWFFGVVVGRDIAILLGGVAIARRSGQIVMSAWAGKAASLWLALTILCVILKADPPVFQVCLWMATGLFVFSFLLYVLRYLQATRGAGDATADPEACRTALFFWIRLLHHGLSRPVYELERRRRAGKARRRTRQDARQLLRQARPHGAGQRHGRRRGAR
jgi:CDP-diacylglycerol--glycerol-3-phosphate 3-phosphatidyltransferase